MAGGSASTDAVVHADDLLFEVAGTLHPSQVSWTFCGGEQQPDKNGNDRGHDEQFDGREGEGAKLPSGEIVDWSRRSPVKDRYRVPVAGAGGER